MSAPIDLHKLLARIALRDRAALRQLYDATSPSLFGVAIRIVNRRDRAEEVLQDAFVNIWNKAAIYNVSTSLPMRYEGTAPLDGPPLATWVLEGLTESLDKVKAHGTFGVAGADFSFRSASHAKV
jgi:hypothetical protein